ncbi:MAG: TetR/AcrR family transcriptional regulator [Archangium sp.]|nr:TetR/AcrR family transcriptional regulator [Archangium sp.]
MVPPSVTVTRPLPRVERRASILRGAATAFSEGGFAATSMDSIAACAGVSKLIVYRHFDSKEELYRAVIEGVAGRLAEAFADATGRGDPSEAPARAFLAVAREDPQGFALLWRHSAREPQFAEYVERFRTLAAAFARSRLAPLLRDASLHEWAAETIVDVLVASVLHWLDRDDGSRDREFVVRAGRSLRALVGAWAE